jgi:hypothetical protein
LLSVLIPRNSAFKHGDLIAAAYDTRARESLLQPNQPFV